MERGPILMHALFSACGVDTSVATMGFWRRVQCERSLSSMKQHLQAVSQWVLSCLEARSEKRIHLWNGWTQYHRQENEVLGSEVHFFYVLCQGRGIPDAKISVNGKEMGRSDAEGIYHLYGMKTGHYEISAVAEQLFFDGTKVKITPNTPQLPDLVATRYTLCFFPFFSVFVKNQWQENVPIRTQNCWCARYVSIFVFTEKGGMSGKCKKKAGKRIRESAALQLDSSSHWQLFAFADSNWFPGTLFCRFSLCGQIVIDQLPEGLSYTSPQRQVTLHPKGDPSKLTTLTSDNQGAFCAEVQPGTYVVKVSARTCNDVQVKRTDIFFVNFPREVEILFEKIYLFLFRDVVISRVKQRMSSVTYVAFHLAQSPCLACVLSCTPCHSSPPRCGKEATWDENRCHCAEMVLPKWAILSKGHFRLNSNVRVPSPRNGNVLLCQWTPCLLASFGQFMSRSCGSECWLKFQLSLLFLYFRSHWVIMSWRLD